MVAIFSALGFKLSGGSKHRCYERASDRMRVRAVVPIDDYDVFDKTMIRSMISQSGFTRDEFYSATKSTARKINARSLFKPCSLCGVQLGSSLDCDVCTTFKAM